MEQPEILSRINKQTGMTVPEGYFQQFAIQMEQQLPEQDFERQPQILPRTLWQKVRPYVYMAAMFAGVWCMMKMFTLMQSSSPSASSELIARAVSNDKYFSEYYDTEIDEIDIYDELYATGADPEALAQDMSN